MSKLAGNLADKWEAYNYTLKDFETYYSCPVCAAKKLKDGIGEPKGQYCKGQIKACNVVLALGYHECDEFKGKKEGDCHV